MSSESDVRELPPLASTRQVAEWAGISLMTIMKRSKNGAFPAPIKIGSRYRWRRSDLLVWLNKQETYSE